MVENPQASSSSSIVSLLQSCCVKLPHLNESSQIHRPWTTQREPINWSVNKPDFNLELMDDNFDGKQMSSSVHKGNFVIAFIISCLFTMDVLVDVLCLKIGWHVSVKCMVKEINWKVSLVFQIRFHSFGKKQFQISDHLSCVMSSRDPTLKSILWIFAKKSHKIIEIPIKERWFSVHFNHVG